MAARARRRIGTGAARAAAAGLMALIAGCGEIPRPFEHDRPNPLLHPGARAGVVVAPVAGAAHPHSLALAMALALRDLDVPAMTDAGNAAAFRLEGVAAPAGDGIAIEWRLTDPENRRAGTHVQRLAADALDDPARLPTVAAAAAPALAGLLAAGRPEPARLHGPTVMVRPVRGAPGDGATSLTGAMAAALRKLGIAVAEEDADFVLRGAVAIRPAGPGYREVEIVWTLAAANGDELGTARQASPVRADLVEGPWGPLADTVARAAAEGIAEIVRRSKGAQAQGRSPFTGR